VTSFPAGGTEELLSGKSTANEAASWRARGLQDVEGTDTVLFLAGPIASISAQPDTTEFEFPEDENKHLVRDITVFVIAAAFVGYFLVKVFLEGDTDEEEQEKKGKDVDPF
jgi:hypothetical protein